MRYIEKQGRREILRLYDKLLEKYNRLNKLNLDTQCLKNKIGCYVDEIENLRLKNKQLEENSNFLSKQNLKYKTELQTLKDCMSKLTYKNKGILKEYFNNSEEVFVVSFDSVILSLQYLLIFKKLFELNIFDYIVDRQFVNNKTADYDNMLINICSSFSSEMINKYMNEDFNKKDFKKIFTNFVCPFLEVGIYGR